MYADNYIDDVLINFAEINYLNFYLYYIKHSESNKIKTSLLINNLNFLEEFRNAVNELLSNKKDVGLLDVRPEFKPQVRHQNEKI